MFHMLYPHPPSCYVLTLPFFWRRNSRAVKMSNVHRNQRHCCSRDRECVQDHHSQQRVERYDSRRGNVMTKVSDVQLFTTISFFFYHAFSLGMIVIPKINSVFTIHIRNSVFTLHGNQFRYRASQRSAKKFKSRPTIDL